MKKHLLFWGLLGVLSTSNTLMFGQKLPDVEAYNQRSMLSKNSINTARQQTDEEPTPEELLGCPKGTILSGTYLSTSGYAGTMAADQGRLDIPTTFYQSFNGAFQTINAIQFIGTFTYFDGTMWIDCLERGGINPETMEITEEIPFEIGFYKPDEKGMPGEQIFKKTIHVLGRFSNVYQRGYQPLYIFQAELGENISLYNGFVSITAAKESEEGASCWFTIVGTTNTPWPAYIYDALGGWAPSLIPASFCLMGDGSFIAQKAIELTRILSPLSEANQKNEKVQIEVTNIGEQPINDITLELWVDGHKIATEQVPACINNMESYVYTFKQRVDCSDGQPHQIEIRNTTEGDEKTTSQTISRSVKPAAYAATGSIYSEYLNSYISSVQIGTINNESDQSAYSDYSDQKAIIHPNEKNELILTFNGERIPETYGVWVDWNNNKSFHDEADLIEMKSVNQETGTATVNIELPQNITVHAGDVRMRICAVWGGTPVAEGLYNYGETEDYTLTIERNANSPILTLDPKYLESELNQNESDNLTFRIINESSHAMDGTIEVEYALPDSPDTNPVITRKPKQTNLNKNISLPGFHTTPIQKAVQPDKNEAAYILKYDKGQTSMIGLDQAAMTHATYYPGYTLRHISGMQIESVTLYINDVPETCKIVIYGEGTQHTCGPLITEQTFIPTAKTWNTITLDKPVTIGQEDLWIGVHFSGCEPGTYQIGVDNGPVAEGFGGLVNIGGTEWWTLPELGLNANYCIRANVSGDRTAAINWLQLDKTDYHLNGEGEEQVTATLSALKLEEGTLYEAIIKVSSNDEINRELRIPVYLTCLKGTDIENRLSDELSLSYQNGVLTVNSNQKEVSTIQVWNTSGQLLTQTTESRVHLANKNKGILLTVIQFTDNSTACIKLIAD